MGYDPRDDAECQICLDKVLLNKKQFGVLDNCDHVFCLKCIRSGRATYDQRTTKHHYRTCPICRQTSYLVVPSYFHATGSDKEARIDEDKGEMFTGEAVAAADGEFRVTMFNDGRWHTRTVSYDVRINE